VPLNGGEQVAPHADSTGFSAFTSTAINLRVDLSKPSGPKSVFTSEKDFAGTDRHAIERGDIWALSPYSQSAPQRSPEHIQTDRMCKTPQRPLISQQMSGFERPRRNRRTRLESLKTRDGRLLPKHLKAQVPLNLIG
jgi:hypothetical protein